MFRHIAEKATAYGYRLRTTLPGGIGVFAGDGSVAESTAIFDGAGGVLAISVADLPSHRDAIDMERMHQHNAAVVGDGPTLAVGPRWYLRTPKRYPTGSVRQLAGWVAGSRAGLATWSGSGSEAQWNGREFAEWLDQLLL